LALKDADGGLMCCCGGMAKGSLGFLIVTLLEEASGEAISAWWYP
jgi:hypothetical protein